ncbi:MAG: class II glutamine amidotransferase [Thioalkalivibrio sp.]|nr:MAG: class II glutamine amidotransferase [Thioalkalivibrio sp.]
MCELLAMSSLEPATLSISLEAFSERGGLSAPHKDGWGAAFYSGRDARRLRETGAASGSSGIRFLNEQQYRSHFVLAHVRQATMGAVSLENTQPFARELGGRMHVFAHNGDLIGLEKATAADLGRFRPIGDTDSEHAFCLLLARLEPLWAGPEVPSLESRLAVLTAFAALLRPFGPANFLYGDSEYLYVHGHERTQETTGRIEPPGLYTLCRTCPSRREGRTPKPIEGLTLGLNDGRQRVTLVASVPLTRESWEPVECGEVLAIKGGQIVARTGAAAPPQPTARPGATA